jgi:tetratricopeptide (TPR) repeat protein
MLFDLSNPRRKNVIRVVYALLAILFAAGFVGWGIGSEAGVGGIVDAITGNGSGSTASQFEDQIEDVEKRLETDPDNPRLLAELASLRAQSGRAQLELDENTGQPILTEDARAEFDKAADAWVRYLDTDPKDPDVGAAASMREAYLLMGDMTGAARAQEIMVRDNPTFNEYFSLADYRYRSLDIKGGDKALEQARKRADDQQQRRYLKQLERLRKQAVDYKKQLEKNPQAENPLANPTGGLGGGGGLVAP